MEVNAIILLSETMEVVPVDVIRDRVKVAECLLNELSDHIATVTIIARPEQKGLGELKLPVVYADAATPGFLVALCKALAPLTRRHTLILSVETPELLTDHVDQLLDYSERLPHMSVVSSHGDGLSFPILLPLDALKQIQIYMDESGQGSLMNWLEQSVFVECERL